MRKYIKFFIIPAVLISVMLINSGCQENIEVNTSTDNTSDVISEITETSEISSSEITDSSIPEDSKEITDKKAILKFIEGYKKTNRLSSAFDISMRFFDFDNDGTVEMLLGEGYETISDYSLYKYNAINDTVVEFSDFVDYQIPVYSETMPFLKCKNAAGEEYYMLFTGVAGWYYMRWEGGEYYNKVLFMNASYDDRPNQRYTYFYQIDPLVQSCIGENIEYITMDEVPFENLVTQETYIDVFSKFKEDIEIVPIEIKSITITYEELMSLSVDEIYEKLQTETLDHELLEHKIFTNQHRTDRWDSTTDDSFIVLSGSNATTKQLGED